MQAGAVEQVSVAGEKTFGLKAKLLIPILGIMLATLLGLGFAVVRTAEKSLLDASREKLFNSAIVVGNSIAQQIHRAKADIAFASKVPDIQAVLDPAAEDSASSRDAFISSTNALLARLGETCGYYETFYVTSREGMTLACSMPSAVGTLNISNRAFFHEAMSGDKVVVSEPFRSRITGDALMAILMRFHHRGYSGAMVGSIQIRKITHDALKQENKSWLQAVVISESGMTVASLNDEEIADRSYADAAWFSGLKSADQGFMPVIQAGKDKMLAFYRLPGTGFFALAIADTDHLLSPVRTVRIIGFVAVVLAVLCAYGVIYYTVNPVTSDIHRLAEAAEEVGRGNLEQSIGIAREDELGALSRSLSTMLANLKQMITRAEEATKAKSDFLTRMSHEIRTPMNAIIGMAYLGLQADPDERQRNCLTKIQQAGENLLGIINDILDFSRVETGKLELNNATFRLSGMLRSIFDLLESKARQKDLTLRLEIAGNVPDVLFGDSLRLSQVCINLFTNALKFTEKGGVILRINLEETRGDDLVLRFSMADTGIGIAEEQKNAIFDAFSQADGSTTRRFGGTGLGLALCKRMVELMDGAIWVDSIPGKGSTFHFTVVLQRGEEGVLQEAHAAAPAQAVEHTEPLRVLVVEDNELNQEIALEMLRAIGITPTLARNGAEAVALSGERAFDIIFMDIQMPVMDGLEAARSIRAGKGPGAATMPIIAMTANAMRGDREKSLAAGMNDHITKPIDHVELEEAVRHWTGRG